MNAFKFRIGNKDSLDIRETFETLEGRRYMPDLFFITNQTSISIIILTNIHIWICLSLQKAKAHKWMQWSSQLQNNNYWFVNGVDTRSNDTK